MKKTKQKKSKEPQYIPKWAPRSEAVDPYHCIKLYAEYKDLFEEPGTPVEQDTKYHIDL